MHIELLNGKFIATLVQYTQARVVAFKQALLVAAASLQVRALAAA